MSTHASARPVLCAVDFSPGSRLAITRAERLACDEGRGLILVHVAHPPRLSFGHPVATAHNLLTSMADDARVRLTSFFELASQHGISAELRVVEGEPWQQIVDLARRTSAGLIVLGAHGHTTLTDALIGSVAERVVRHAPCSVLVVRSDAAPDLG